MFSGDFMKHDGALSAYIDDNHNYFSRYKSYYQKDKLGCVGKKILQRYA